MISVIVPTLNESRSIRDCLTALRAQSIAADDFEIVIVDNGSRDDTVEIAREFSDRVYSFPGVTVGALRNQGAKLARGEVLAFIDADCVASRTWLEGASAALAEGGVAVGNKYDRPDDRRWIEALWLGAAVQGRVATEELWSGNLVVRRAEFLASGGFDETLVSYEDVALSRALGKRGPLYMDGRVRVVHTGGPKSLLEFARQQLWHGFEEWTLFRRGIKRDTFVPTVACIAGYGLILLSLFFASPARLALAAAGALLVLGATAWRLARHLRSFDRPGFRTVLRLGVLNVVSLTSKAAAVVIRACGLHWSGRRKTVAVASV